MLPLESLQLLFSQGELAHLNVGKVSCGRSADAELEEFTSQPPIPPNRLPQEIRFLIIPSLSLQILLRVNPL
jgi:hypothetical protein